MCAMCKCSLNQYREVPIGYAYNRKRTHTTSHFNPQEEGTLFDFRSGSLSFGCSEVVLKAEPRELRGQLCCYIAFAIVFSELMEVK